MYQDWKEMPSGYYADNKIKTDYERRRAEEQRFIRLVDAELSKMGVGPDGDIPSTDQIREAEKIARRLF